MKAREEEILASDRYGADEVGPQVQAGEMGIRVSTRCFPAAKP